MVAETGQDWRIDQARRPAALWAGALSAFEHERARYFLWTPVLLGGGIALYFSLPVEPALMAALAPLAGALALHMTVRGSHAADVLATALVAAALGFAIAKVRSDGVAAPILEREMRSVDVVGVAELVEARISRGQRITLKVSSLGDVPPEKRPHRVRIRTLMDSNVRAGDVMRLRATLAAPAAPVLPGAYDFGRQAWFEGLGAVGYSLSPPTIERTSVPAGVIEDARASIERLRQDIGRRIAAALPGVTGAIATALITGERGGVSSETTDAYRDSGLVHVLSISGLHMAIMAGAAFLALRIAFAAVPSLVLRYPVKKWAAAGAAIAAFGYLLISGGQPATLRSYIMISIMFLAILLGRRALAMRNVALAALVILLIWPESLLDAGFQMSFAAVVALVAAYEIVHKRTERRDPFGPILRILLFFSGVALSTIVAGLAVAPFAAYHFHQSQQFAVLANLVVIPLCNLIVMPAALLTLIALPFGLEALPLWIMGQGIDTMSFAARYVAKLPGAVGHVPAMPAAAFAGIVVGGLWLTLWQSRLRFLGIVPLAIGLALAPTLRRADVLVGVEGRLVAARGEAGSLSVIGERQTGFELRSWLEHDGDARTPAEAAKGSTFVCDGAGCTTGVRALRLAVSRHPSSLRDDCAAADIVIVAHPRPAFCKLPRAVLDYDALKKKGTHALYIEASGTIRVETVAEARGARPWTERPASPTTVGRDSPPSGRTPRVRATDPPRAAFEDAETEDPDDAGAQ